MTTKPVFTSYNSFPVNRTPLAKNKNILFLSSANKYNIEGIDWFITNVMATLKGVLPSVKLIMGGSVCNVLKNRYSDCENIRFVGQVDDLFEFYSMGDIAVNPVFNGTGLKIKTFEAMSFGKVLIANPHSVEGVFNLNSCPVKIATSSNDYVEIITELINNPSEIKNLSDLSVKYISELNNEVKRVFLQTIEC